MTLDNAPQSHFVLDMALIKALHQDRFRLRDVVSALMEIEPSSRIFCTGAQDVFVVETDRDLGFRVFVDLLWSLTKRKYADQEGVPA